VTDASFSGTEIERSLVALGRAVDYPPQPDLAAEVRRRIHAAPGPPPAWRTFLSSLRQPAATAVAAVVVLCAFLIVWEPAREAVADWLGVDDVRITFQRPPEQPVARELDLGEEMTLQDAEEKTEFEVLVPEDLGAPDEVYVDDRVPSGMVSLVYAASDDLPRANAGGAGLIVSQFEADLDKSEVFTKFVRFDSTVSEVTVRGVSGYWIDAPHELFYIDTEGEEAVQESRLAGPALVWQEGSRVFRIESELSRSEVVNIAESMR
jgi:hypothetical protein